MGSAPLGGGRTEPDPTDRTKRGVKRSVMIDGRDVPPGVVFHEANYNNHKLMLTTIEAIPVRRPKPTGRRCGLHATASKYKINSRESAGDPSFSCRQTNKRKVSTPSDAQALRGDWRRYFLFQKRERHLG